MNSLKIIVTGLAICIHAFSFGQIEKEIESSIKKVTVYSLGAQMESEASFTSQTGQMILKLTGLSPYINAESIRIGGDGSFTILNVQHQNDYLNELDKNKEMESIKSRIEELRFKTEEEETRIKIIDEKLDFLNANRQITGKEQTIDPENFKSFNFFFGSNIEELNLENLKKRRLINEYQNEIDKLVNQSNSINSSPDLPSGTIIITIDSKQSKITKLNFTCYVNNASWYPSYDVRFQGINKPLVVTYKANIKQNTGVDWKDVNLVLSTAKTGISAQIPEFSTHYLDFYYPEITYALAARASGLQITDDGLTGSDSGIKIRGISEPGENEPLYIVDGVPQNDISGLRPEGIANIEVLKDASSTAIYGSRGSNGVLRITTKRKGDNPSIPLLISSKAETSVEYSIEAHQTIQSNNKIANVIYKESFLESEYDYRTIPFLSENVFLVAKIPDWYKAEFIDGEANLYLENSFIGKSIINARQFTDTLEISFGVDNHIGIKREKMNDFEEDQLIGLNRKETTGYTITLRNNKPYPVTTKVTDQVPVSTTKDIQVDIIDLSEGIMEKDSGMIEWDVKLNPGESKKILVKYSVKYPKDKMVVL
jgi:TonB-dependent SusC/RagA subfamily outer membrane receptor